MGQRHGRMSSSASASSAIDSNRLRYEWNTSLGRHNSTSGYKCKTCNLMFVSTEALDMHEYWHTQISTSNDTSGSLSPAMTITSHGSIERPRQQDHDHSRTIDEPRNTSSTSPTEVHFNHSSDADELEEPLVLEEVNSCSLGGAGGRRHIGTPATITYPMPVNPSLLRRRSDDVQTEYCDLCDRTFRSKKALRDHKRQSPLHKPDVSHYCRPCARAFTSDEAYRNHLRHSTAHNDPQPPLRAGSSSSSMRGNIQRFTSPPISTFSAFASALQSRASLRSTTADAILRSRSLLRVQSEDPEALNTVGIREVEDTSMHGDMSARSPQVGSGSPSHYCDQCNRRFRCARSLLQHRRDSPLHRLDTPHPVDCEPCNRTFATTSAYRSHVTNSPAHMARALAEIESPPAEEPDVDGDNLWGTPSASRYAARSIAETLDVESSHRESFAGTIPSYTSYAYNQSPYGQVIVVPGDEEDSNFRDDDSWRDSDSVSSHPVPVIPRIPVRPSSNEPGDTNSVDIPPSVTTPLSPVHYVNEFDRPHEGELWYVSPRRSRSPSNSDRDHDSIRTRYPRSSHPIFYGYSIPSRSPQSYYVPESSPTQVYLSDVVSYLSASDSESSRSGFYPGGNQDSRDEENPSANNGNEANEDTATSTNSARSSRQYMYECPLCFEKKENLSSVPCGHVFCTRCIRNALYADRRCPLCRKMAHSNDLRRIYLSSGS